LRRDLPAPLASFESLTFAAASGVLGVRAAGRGPPSRRHRLRPGHGGRFGLGAAAAASLDWRPPGRLRRVVRGSWLLFVVAGEAVAWERPLAVTEALVGLGALRFSAGTSAERHRKANPLGETVGG
jgi:hypothetical protein